MSNFIPIRRHAQFSRQHPRSELRPRKGGRGRAAVEGFVWIESLEGRRLLGGDPPIIIDHGGVSLPGAEAQVAARWTSTATNTSTGSDGNPITLTWGFVADGLSIPGSSQGDPTAPSSLQQSLDLLYGPSVVWQPLFQNVFDRWSTLAGLSYVFTGYADDGAAFVSSEGVLGTRPDVRIGGHPIDGTSNTLAYNYYPNVGDMVIDTAEFGSNGYFQNMSGGNLRLRNTIAHEQGHGLGFAHVLPDDNSKLMEPSITTAFDGPQFDDIYAAQKNYGDPYEKGGRNDTAATADDFGTFSSNVTALAVSRWVLPNNPVNARSIANTGDYDYFKFMLTTTKTVSTTVTPFGPTYLEGPQGGTTSSFNASAQGDLAITLFGGDGAGGISYVNSTGLGSAETMTANLPAGTYYLRVSIAGGSTQPYDLSFTTANAGPITPAGTPDLDSDTGISNTDNITANNRPYFTGTANVGGWVDLYTGNVHVGSGFANDAGVYLIQPVLPLADGNYTINARLRTGNTAVSADLKFTIDTVAPPAPINVRLRADNDTGVSNSDNVTRITQPFFTGGVQNSAYLAVGWNTFFPLATSTTGGNTQVQMPFPLTDGAYQFQGAAMDVAGNYSARQSFWVTIDTTAPTLSQSSFQRSPSQAIDFTFSENVYGTVNLNLIRSDFITLNVVPVAGPPNTRRFIPAAANSLADGVYTNQLTTQSLTDLAGNGISNLTISTFKFMRADFDGNHKVNFDDLLVVAQHYGTTGLTHDDGDANYDGKINFDDLLIVAQTYSTSVLSATALSASRRRDSAGSHTDLLV